MELRALRYFVEVVRQQSFTAAAERMFVTQPTISKMVKALEDEIGSPLLLRDGRQMVLTDAGKIVYQRGQDVLAAHAQLQAELDDLGTFGRGQLTVGIPAMGGTLFTQVIAAFRQRYPKVELKLFEQGSRAIEAALLAGELELGGLLQPVDTSVFDVLPVSRHPLWLVAQTQSRWHGAQRVELSDLANESFVFYGESLALNDIVLDACRKAGFTLAAAATGTSSPRWSPPGSGSRFYRARIATGLIRHASRRCRSSRKFRGTWRSDGAATAICHMRHARGSASRGSCCRASATRTSPGRWPELERHARGGSPCTPAAGHPLASADRRSIRY
jgi:DNA-binding transcriptional LysR family regulator